MKDQPRALLAETCRANALLRLSFRVDANARLNAADVEPSSFATAKNNPAQARLLRNLKGGVIWEYDIGSPGARYDHGGDQQSGTTIVDRCSRSPPRGDLRSNRRWHPHRGHREGGRRQPVADLHDREGPPQVTTSTRLDEPVFKGGLKYLKGGVKMNQPQGHQPGWHIPSSKASPWHTSPQSGLESQTFRARNSGSTHGHQNHPTLLSSCTFQSYSTKASTSSQSKPNSYSSS